MDFTAYKPLSIKWMIFKWWKASLQEKNNSFQFYNNYANTRVLGFHCYLARPCTQKREDIESGEKESGKYEADKPYRTAAF